MTERAPVLAAQGLTRAFASGHQTVSVLERLDLSLAAGQSLALIGRSGSGKSTLLNLLCGMDSADAGTITVLGERFEAGDGEPAHVRHRRWAALRRQRIGVVFQDANLMPALTLLQNVRLRAQLAGQPLAPCRDWLERLGLAAEADRYPDQVSGGQRQRAALAMSFAMTPALILADEPTGSLDRHTADEVATLLFDTLARSPAGARGTTGAALILATHDPELAARCDRIMDLGHRASAGRASTDTSS
ncbi:ABC transporter ATP-binding protein [Marinobacter sp. C2H3]|uniref:ABC transporter ATP-binding protein n=1 Tax=Marinobacter sp. C2H3 TaxID=3119003 RepID=UPI00300ED804